MPPSRTFFPAAALLGTVLAMLPTAAGAPVQPTQIAGVYTSVSEVPVSDFVRATGEMKQIGTARRTYSLELRPDGTLRARVVNRTRDGWTWQARGVWQLKGDRLYFVQQQFTWKGMPNDVRELGAARVSVAEDGIAFSEVAGAELGARALTRTTSADLGPAVTAAEVAPLKPVLAQVVGPVPRVPYVGAPSEQALKEIVHRAVAARDVAALLRVTYPLLADIQHDPDFDAYMSYMNCIAFDGVLQVSDVPEAEAAADLAYAKRHDGRTFPASVSPRGMFMISRTTSYGGNLIGYYYGVVAGKWALVGNPYNAERVAALRRQLHGQPGSPAAPPARPGE